MVVSQMEQMNPYYTKILDSYYNDEAKKLHKFVNKVVNEKFGGTADKDMAEFYSEANDVFADIVKFDRYDPSKGEFDGFLYGALILAFIDLLKKQNRDKRTTKIEIEIDGEKKKVSVPDVYLDTPISDSDDSTIGDMIPSDLDTNVELMKKMDNIYNDKIENYLNTLPDLPRKIAKLIMKGYSAKEIKWRLDLTDKQYRNSLNVMKLYEKKRVLYNENNTLEDDEMNATVLIEDVAETYKNTSYSIESISKQLQKKRIRDDHILQRHSGQWKSFAKSELISDILRGKSLTQIIISEEIKNGLRMQWLIDGKQRCTTLDDYLHDGFAISRNVKNFNIRYQTDKVDKNGNEVLNEDGFTETEFMEFDIRGKKFSQLPEELQDIFKDRQIPVLYNMNCTKKDIADDIARFNRSRPMNKAQNGWLGLDESFAEFVENIAKMQFFQPDFAGSTYTNTNNTSGLIRRIIVEGVMVSDFIDEFSKDFDKMCEFLSEEASDSNFTEFYSLIERLTLVCNEKVAKLFDTKDSFLWFGLFSKFANTGVEDKKFIDFMIEFNNNLRHKKVNGISFEELCVNPETGKTRSTKDKNIVVSKMKILEILMMEYLHIEKNIDEDMDAESFISENVGISLEEVNEDIECYEETLDSLEEKTIKVGSKLLEPSNRLSLLAMVAYSFKNDVDLDCWLEEYAKNNNTYLSDQKKNFCCMVESLNSYYKKVGAA